MAAVPTVLEKTLEAVFIPIEYEEYTERRCYGSTVGDTDPPEEPSECINVITRTVTLAYGEELGAGITLAPGEFVFHMAFLGGFDVRYTLARLECSP